MNRRQLLLALAAPAFAARKIRLGLIGLDGHPDEILRPLPQLPDVELVAFAGVESNRIKVRRYADYTEMLRKESLDCVAVCNNDGERAAAVIACAERKLDVIAEKPLAISRAELKAVIAAVEKNHVHCGMLLPMRFSPPFLAMKQIVDSGEIGEVAQMDAQKSYQLDARPEWQKHASTYGSTILWIGIHMIDLMSFTSGRRFTQAASFQSHVAYPELGDMENVTATVFKLDNGGTATLRMDYLRPASVKGHGDDRLRLAGTRGIVEYQEEHGVTVIGPKGERTLKDLPASKSVFVDFLSAKPTLTWEEIVRVNEVTIAADEASKSGRVVAI